MIERTVNPTGVLVHGGVHTSDVRDYVHNADALWRGGKAVRTGFSGWCGVLPEDVVPDP